MSNLANPKMVAFFLSLLPQFVPPGVPPVTAFVLLGLLFCLLTFGWLSLYAVALDRARALFRAAMSAAPSRALPGPCW